MRDVTGDEPLVRLPAPTPTPTGRIRRTARRHPVLFRLGAIAGVILVFLSVRAWVLSPVRVPSQSMSPTLHRHDLVLVQKVGHGKVNRRQIIAFDDPVRHVLRVKRVVGVAGDVIEIRNAILYVNDKPVFEPAVNYPRIRGLYFGPVRVPPNAVFVLGDNRGRSRDSRDYGPVPLANVIGRITVAVSPRKLVG
jgi:signal peptidase I